MVIKIDNYFIYLLFVYNQINSNCMDKFTIQESMKEEIRRMLIARDKRNGGTLNLFDVIDEAKFSLAVNLILTQRQLFQKSNGKMQIVDPLTIEYMFEGMFKALKQFFPNDFDQYHINQIKEEYAELMSKDNVEDMINSHYNDLFQDYSSNIL